MSHAVVEFSSTKPCLLTLLLLLRDEVKLTRINYAYNCDGPLGIRHWVSEITFIIVAIVVYKQSSLFDFNLFLLFSVTFEHLFIKREHGAALCRPLHVQGAENMVWVENRDLQAEAWPRPRGFVGHCHLGRRRDRGQQWGMRRALLSTWAWVWAEWAAQGAWGSRISLTLNRELTKSRNVCVQRKW